MAKTGRPTKYKEEYCKGIVKYFEDVYKALERDKVIPFFSTFGREICDVSPDKMSKWAKKHKKFRQAYKKAKAIQKECLIAGALKGLFNPTAFIFTAKNITDMKDKQEHEHSGKVDHNVVYLPIPRKEDE